jgi:hypothetical protein
MSYCEVMTILGSPILAIRVGLDIGGILVQIKTFSDGFNPLRSLCCMTRAIVDLCQQTKSEENNELIDFLVFNFKSIVLKVLLFILLFTP